MQQSYTTAAKHYQKQRRWNSNWRKVTTILASVVVFITTYALILPAITMEPEYICGKEAHVHTDACYQLAEPIHMSNLICTFDTLGIHKHTNECYTEDSELICGYADFVLHTHSSHCYDQDGELVCALPELKEHIHDEACWKQPHVHGETCFVQQRGELLCTVQEGSEHTHLDTCYTAQQNLICTVPESVPHKHTVEACYTETKDLLCTEPEVTAHTHSDSCYTVERTMTCTREELEGHTHSDACYDNGSLTCALPEIAGHKHDDTCYETTSTFSCTLQETEGHTHLDTCYSAPVSKLTCTTEETDGHTHGSECFEPVRVVTCTLEENVPHVHTDACFHCTPVLQCTEQITEGETAAILSCQEDERMLHIHDVSCLDESGALVCGKLELREHIHEDACFVETVESTEELVLTCDYEEHEHTEECIPEEDGTDATLPGEETPIVGLYCGYVEHVHQDGCFNEENTLLCTMTEHEHSWICELIPSDFTAVETADDWEADLPELNGQIAEDLIAVAKSQLGYAENEANYIIEDDELFYYNRYSAWWNEAYPYTPWNAKFLSFCLNYANIDFELYEDPASWFDNLQWNGQLLPEGYSPIAADLVFFDLDNDESADRVGIIAKVDNTAGRFGVILERRGLVQQVNYDLDDSDILGFARIPGNVPAVELQSVNSERVQKVIDLIDAMPSYDEVFAQLDVYYEADDAEGEETYYTAVVQQVGDVYFEYSILTDAEKEQVTNADKLLELEFIWSQTILLDEITSDTPKTVSSVSTKDFITLNLYDYSSNINDKWKNNNKWPGFQWNGGAYMTSYAFSRTRVDNIDFGNSMITDYDYGSSGTSITNGKSSNSKDVVSNDNGRGLINGKGDTYTNTPIGVSTGTDVMAGKLSSGGYPMLKEISSDTLYWLFQDGTYAKKKNTQNIDGLFQKNEETGEYYYDCRDNHAQYGNNKFTLYKQIITPNFIIYPFGNFLPLNDITNGSNATQVSKITNIGTYVQGVINDLVYDDTVDSTRQQLIDMLARYRTNLQNAGYWNSWGATNVIQEYLTAQSYSGSPSTSLLKRLYNIDWDVDTNFFFGMEMRMNFMQPKDGMTGKNNAYPMVFHFAGDDDVWVYIDNTLFLDLSGIHRHVGGDIDFVNGKVHYYKFETYVDGEIQSTPFKTLTFAEILKTYGGIAEADLGKYLKKDASGNYTTFLDYSTHKFDFFYMERGSGSSVCRINFNFPLLRKNSINITKKNTANVDVSGSPDYYFNVMAEANGATAGLFVGPNSKTGITQYKVMDSGGNIIQENGQDKLYTIGTDGIFKIKAGQTAVFEGVSENSGQFYVQELIPEADVPQYGGDTSSTTTATGDVYVNGTTARYRQLINWKDRSYFTDTDSNSETGPLGYRWWGYSGPTADSSTNSSFYFEQDNHVDVAALGSLAISKKLVVNKTEAQSARLVSARAPEFSFYVTLDGTPLPKGSAYNVGSEARTVTQAGYISVPAGQTAVIEHILSGSKYTVKEINNDGYTVSYTTTNGSYNSTAEQVEGTIITSDSVQVTVTNSLGAAAVEIPVTKTLPATDGVARDFTFVLQQVTGMNDLTPAGTAETVTLNLSETELWKEGMFSLSYADFEITELPSTYYYLITEQPGEDTSVRYDPTVYLAEVQIDNAGSGQASASVTGFWIQEVTPDRVTWTSCDTVGADFTNVIVGELTLSKEVVGAETDHGFKFSLTLAPGTSGVEIVDEYPVVIVQQDGAVDPNFPTWAFNDGTAVFAGFKDGESVTVKNIPIGTQWTVTEDSETGAGYTPTYTVTQGGSETSGGGWTASGTVVPGGTAIRYINTIGYELPETGGGGTMVYRLVGSGMLLTPIPILWRKKTRPRGRRGDGN